MSGFTPSLHVVEVAGGVRLRLAGIGYADGLTLQDAADELVRKLLLMAMALRSGAIGPVGFGLRPDPAALDFLWELGQIAAAGGDIRQRLFGTNAFAA